MSQICREVVKNKNMEKEEEKLNKELAQELKQAKGEIRGSCLKSDWDYFYLKKGKGRIKEFEKRMAELGCPLEYKKIKPMNFYPIGLDVVSVLVIKELLSLDDKEMEDFGASVVNFSLLLKLFMRYFGSLALIAEQVPKMWKRHFTVGELQMTEFDEKERYLVLTLRKFKVHPIYCIIFRGYFSKITEMITRVPPVCQETKCLFKGDEYHEFLLKW